MYKYSLISCHVSFDIIKLTANVKLLSSLQRMSINLQQLSLSLPCSQKMSDKGILSYRSALYHGGQKIVIKTPEVEYSGLHSRVINGSISLAIPIDSWTRTQLNTLEDFALGHVIIPDDVVAPAGASRDYRPIWPHPVAFVMCSQWCNYFWRNPETGHCTSVTPEHLTRPGLYSFSIEVPYVYIGPHKGGERFSLTLRLVQVTYTPLSNVEQQQQQQQQQQALPPPPPTPPPVTQAQRVMLKRVPTMMSISNIPMPPPPPPQPAPELIPHPSHIFQ